jgi:hypothetical protein
MKSFFKTLLLSAGLMFFTQHSAQAQDSKEKFEEVSNYFKSKDYDKALKLTFKILDNKKDLSYDYLYLSYQVSFLGYLIYSDINYKLKDEEMAKTFIELSKDYLDMCVTVNPGMAKNFEGRYKLINTILNPEEAKKDTEKSETSTNESNDKIVNIISSGEGLTLDLAINNALRKAIEKAFGVFVMAKTEIANDQLIDDQMATIASGNILSYSIISQTEKNEAYNITLNAKVSPENIVLRAVKAGKELVLKGNIYYQNILKEEFYKNEEPKLLRAFYEQWSSVKLFDYEVVEGEMFRKVPQSEGEWPYPRIGGTVSRADMIKYNCKILGYYKSWDGEKWDHLPTRQGVGELYQIPYVISVNKNENYYNFIKAYVQLLHQITPKDIIGYRDKYGDPIVLWGYVYQNLMNAIETKSTYKTYGERSKYDGHYYDDLEKLPYGQIWLRNNDTLIELKAIYQMVLFQSSCGNMTLKGFNGYTLPPAFLSHDTRYQLSEDWSLSRNNTLPYPHWDGPLDFQEVKMLLSFTKDELSKLNQKIVVEFNN